MQVDATTFGEFFKTLADLIAQFGWAKGTLTVFFWVAHWWIYREYRGRLNDRQREIDRVAADNKDYREYFMKWLEGERLKQLPPPTKEG